MLLKEYTLEERNRLKYEILIERNGFLETEFNETSKKISQVQLCQGNRTLDNGFGIFENKAVRKFLEWHDFERN